MLSLRRQTSVAPLPVADFGHVLAVLVDVLSPVLRDEPCAPSDGYPREQPRTSLGRDLDATLVVIRSVTEALGLLRERLEV